MMLVMVGFGLQVSARTDRRADMGQLSFVFRLGEQIELNQPLKDIALLLFGKGSNSEPKVRPGATTANQAVRAAVLLLHEPPTPGAR